MKNKRSTIYDCYEIFPSELVFTSRVTDVESAQVICKRTGERSSFLRFAFPNWVNIIGVTPEQQILLVRQFRFGTKMVETEIPGGVIHPDESPENAGVRELLEETGYEGKNPRVIGKVCPNPALQDNTCYTVLVEDVQKVAEQNLDAMEDIDIDLLAIAEVFEMLRKGQIHHGLVLNAFMFYQGYLSMDAA